MPIPALVMGGISLMSFANNLLSNKQALREQQQAFQQYLGALKQDQSRWDDRYGGIEEQLSGFLSGTESPAERMRRETTERRLGQSQFSQLAGGIASDYEGAKSSAEASIAGAGLNTSGAVATTQARLGEAVIKAGSEARLAGLESGRRSMFSFLQSGGQRPGTAQGYAANPALTGANVMPLDAFPLLQGAESVFSAFAGQGGGGRTTGAPGYGVRLPAPTTRPAWTPRNY
jgi:hypothetical protein